MEYITKKKKKLTGKRLETFLKFWDIFGSTCNYKKDKANAADAWLDIPTLTDQICAQIFLGAKNEALRRQRVLDSGRTPIYAQGWITARRWEDAITDEKPKPRAPGVSSYDNLVRGYNILVNHPTKFDAFCYGVNMPPGDKEAIENKYHLAYDVKQLAAGIGG